MYWFIGLTNKVRLYVVGLTEVVSFISVPGALTVWVIYSFNNLNVVKHPVIAVLILASILSIWYLMYQLSSVLQKLTEKKMGNFGVSPFAPVNVLVQFIFSFPLLASYKRLVKSEEKLWKLFKDNFPTLDSELGPLSREMFYSLDSLLYWNWDSGDKKEFFSVFEFLIILRYKKSLYKKRGDYGEFLSFRELLGDKRSFKNLHKTNVQTSIDLQRGNK